MLLIFLWERCVSSACPGASKLPECVLRTCGDRATWVGGRSLSRVRRYWGEGSGVRLSGSLCIRGAPSPGVGRGVGSPTAWLDSCCLSQLAQSASLHPRVPLLPGVGELSEVVKDDSSCLHFDLKLSGWLLSSLSRAQVEEPGGQRSPWWEPKLTPQAVRTVLSQQDPVCD